MRLGIHTLHQREIIKYFQDRLRVQFWVMIGLAAATMVLLTAFMFRPPMPAESLTIALIHGRTVSGSGFLVGGDLVLTTARIAANANELALLFPDKPMITGKVIFADAASDVALIEAKDVPSSLKPLALGNSDTVVDGDQADLAGYPAEAYAVTHTVLSKKISGSTFIETDAVTDPGNSGGALIRSSDGTVVAMVLSTPELGGPKDQGKHRGIPVNLIDRICREHQRAIR
jgi:S1-C subfamily serine protease